MLLSIIKFSLFFLSCVKAQSPNSVSEDLNELGNLVNIIKSLGLNESSSAASGFRLPASLKPIEYFIKIFPVLTDEHERFRGFAQIDFEVVEETRFVPLHMVDLELERDSLEITLFDENGSESMKIVDEAYYPKIEVSGFVLGKFAPVGSKIRFSSFYSGLLVKNTYGLNRFFYEEEDGSKTRFLATYFQPVGARRVFPCMDEPSLKAQFTLHIAASEEKLVLSNMPVNRTTQSEDSTFLWTEFQKTYRMSTYLVAFLICDLTTDLNFKSQITRVWSRKIMQKNSDYASSLAPKVLRWYESYFGVDYPLSKLDLVALPDYPVPGMENFGLIFSQEDSLTTNGKMDRKEWVATVTAHEIAHQWVGNLVTPSWWSEYWLSEGFATYFAARALDETEPELEAINHMMAESVRLILVQDEEDRAADLTVKQFDPLVAAGKIIEIYYKGAAVLRMLNSVLGEELFSTGIKTYFNKYKFSSVSEEDFYSVLNEELLACNKTLPTSLTNFMETWTMQKGFPLITAKRWPNGTVTVKQEYFEPKNPSTFSEESSSPSSHSPSAWWIPISFFTSRNPDFSTAPKVWLPPTNASVVLEGVTPDDQWVVLNSQQASYLRVNYDKGLWRAISDQLLQDHHKIHLLNRAQLFEDAFHLLDSGFVNAEQPLDLMRYLGKEKNFIPLKAALRRFSEIEILMRGNIHYTLLKTFMSSIISPQLEEDFGRSHTEIKRYHLALSWACKFQSPSCTELARKLFAEWKIKNNINVFPETAVNALFCSAIESGSNEDWDLAFERSFSASDFEGKGIVRNSLSCSRNKTTILRYLNSVLYNNHGNHNLTVDVAEEVFNNLVRSIRWNHFTWAFLIINLDEMKKRFGEFPPIPFVSTPYDYFQLVKMLEKIYKGEFDASSPYFEESKRLSDSAGKTIFQVSAWLIKHAPFDTFR